MALGFRLMSYFEDLAKARQFLLPGVVCPKLPQMVEWPVFQGPTFLFQRCEASALAQVDIQMELNNESSP